MPLSAWLGFILGLMCSLGWMYPGLAQTSTPAVEINIPFAPVRLDGEILFWVTGEPAQGMNLMPGEALPVVRRAQVIQKQLHEVLHQGFDPDSLQTHIRPEANGTVVITLADGQNLRERPLFTLAESDARLSGFSFAETQTHVAKTVEKALIQAYRERQPTFLFTQAGRTILGLGVLGLVSMGLSWGQKRLYQREWELRMAQAQATQNLMERCSNAEPEDVSLADCAATQTMRLQVIHYDRAIARLDLYLNILRTLHLGMWMGGLIGLLGWWPYTRGLQRVFVQQPWVLVWLLSLNLVIKYGGIVIDSSLDRWVHRRSLAPSAMQRWQLRANSFAPILKTVLGLLLLVLTLVVVAQVYGVPLMPFWAGAGIVGLALSLGAQTLVRDMIYGTLFLLEDQFALGDFVLLNDTFGRVEKFNLRSTTVRNRQGALITLANGEIRLVQNLSKDWARHKLYIYIDYEADIDSTCAVLLQVAQGMQADPFWGAQIVAAEIRGVEDLDADGFTVGVRFETAPGVYRKVAREYRRRLKPALAAAGIHLGTRLVYVRPEDMKHPHQAKHP